MALIRFHLPTRNTCAISSSFLHLLLSPCSMFENDTGSTIKNAINTDRLTELIHTKANIIKDATGVAFIIFKGDISSYITLLL